MASHAHFVVCDKNCAGVLEWAVALAIAASKLEIPAQACIAYFLASFGHFAILDFDRGVKTYFSSFALSFGDGAFGDLSDALCLLLRLLFPGRGFAFREFRLDSFFPGSFSLREIPGKVCTPQGVCCCFSFSDASRECLAFWLVLSICLCPLFPDPIVDASKLVGDGSGLGRL